MVCGEEAAAVFLRHWLADKTDVVLVTGRGSYSRCGAEAVVSPFLRGRRVTHLTTAGENVRIEDVEKAAKALPSRFDAFVAVGGGTVVDTAKLLRNGLPGSVREGVPFLAMPTTAGSGAEATRFAAYFENGTKKSADDVRYLPTDVILLPEMTATQTAYQRAATEFDAYAQAVESLWSKRATDESRAYARKALDLMASGRQMLGAYWAGRAIDISRTTAAHALSYYLTANYGIPHGHAVYMTFEYVCRNNGCPEFARTVPGLTTLRDFADEKNLDWSGLVDTLFAQVNCERLENNPVAMRKESFL